MLEIILQYYLGLFFLYFGLNGFFNFHNLPRPSDRMILFLKNIEETKFILPTVKIIEIISAGLLISGFGKLFALILLLPIVFGIGASQAIFNFEKGKGIMLLTVIPFSIYFILKCGLFFA